VCGWGRVFDCIDLTYGIAETGSKYPTDPAPSIRVSAAAVSPEGKVSSAYTELVLRSHHGTHIDAPAHKIPGGKTIDTYNVTKFINRTLLIDLTRHFPEPGHGYVQRVTREVLMRVVSGEAVARIRKFAVSALVFRTGYDKTIMRGVSDDCAFPHVEKEAAEFLVDTLEKNGVGLNIVGIDSFSVDPKGSWDSPAHRALLSRDILILETLVNLGAVAQVFGEQPFELMCAPIPYRGADAAQARAFVRVISPEH